MRLLQFSALRLHRWQCLAANRIQFYSTEGCTDFTVCMDLDLPK